MELARFGLYSLSAVLVLLLYAFSYLLARLFRKNRILWSLVILPPLWTLIMYGWSAYYEAIFTRGFFMPPVKLTACLFLLSIFWIYSYIPGVFALLVLLNKTLRYYFLNRNKKAG
jgi:hypothetical protein